MRDHTKLRAFELADEVAVLIYLFSNQSVSKRRGLRADLPDEKSGDFGTVEHRRKGVRGRVRANTCAFSEIAFGSLRELHYQFGLARRLGCADESGAPLCDSKWSNREGSKCAYTFNAQGLTVFSLQPNSL